MNNDPVYQRLREVSWRRPLTATEQAELAAWLAAHPEARAEHEAESALNGLIARLPEAPLASNFTARVLQAIEREEAATIRAPVSRDRAWYWRVLLPRVAVVTLMVGAGGIFGYRQYHLNQIQGMGESIVTVAGMPELPGMDILADFDAIQKLDSGSAADRELLALLQ